jgi:hypothetical protein
MISSIDLPFRVTSMSPNESLKIAGVATSPRYRLGGAGGVGVCGLAAGDFFVPSQRHEIAE